MVQGAEDQMTKRTKPRTMKRSHFILFIALFIGLPTTAQEYGSGEDSVECIKELNIYRDFRDSKEFEKAVPHWQKSVELCPRASKRLYIDGVKFYESFMERTDDTAQKRAYLDSVMWVLDKRIKEYGEEDKVKGMKGSKLVKYRKWLPPEKLLKGNRLLRESVHSLKKEAFPPHVGRYYVSLYFLYQMDTMSLREIALEYVPISYYVDQNLRDPKNEKYKKFYEKKKNVE